MLKSTDISYDLEDDRVIKRIVSKCKLGKEMSELTEHKSQSNEKP